MGLKRPTGLIPTCADCELKVCPAWCFDKHPGSAIALQKLVAENEAKGIKVHVVIVE